MILTLVISLLIFSPSSEFFSFTSWTFSLAADHSFIICNIHGGHKNEVTTELLINGIKSYLRLQMALDIFRQIQMSNNQYNNISITYYMHDLIYNVNCCASAAKSRHDMRHNMNDVNAPSCVSSSSQTMNSTPKPYVRWIVA